MKRAYGTWMMVSGTQWVLMKCLLSARGRVSESLRIIGRLDSHISALLDISTAYFHPKPVLCIFLPQA